ncbi:unnamed protein product [Echinostoma caproni]|uniref:Integrase catalytic domain-containing protein n=1 Tax=Echinostoma caproni TaxID=27848 RepID=A0A183BCP2_9TREM|nr:unnamed protein product [Echinostoma caproni]
MVKTVKNAIASTSTKTISELEMLLDNFLLQYRNIVHATTKENPGKLFKAGSLRSSLQCVNSSDIVHFRGNDMRPSKGIIIRKISQAMIEITDLTDATVHRCHINHIHFNEIPTSDEDPVKETQENPPCATPQSPIPETSTDENSPVTLRRPTRRSSQIDEALLRDKICGDPAL